MDCSRVSLTFLTHFTLLRTSKHCPHETNQLVGNCDIAQVSTRLLQFQHISSLNICTELYK